MPAIAKMLIVFILIAITLKLKVPLVISMLIGSIMIFLFFNPDVSIIPKIISGGVLSFNTVSLVFIIFLILVFSGILKVSGRLSHITEAFESAFGGGSSLFIIFPSVIGLLPMPGGAIFSAPMIEEKGLKENFSPVRLSAINFWFRHIWELMWFLYPGIIISAEIFKLNIWDIVIHNLPLTPLAMFFGWFFLLRGKVSSKVKIRWEKVPIFFYRLLPIFILVFSNILLQNVLSIANIDIHRNIIMIVCLLVTILYVIIIDKPSGKQVLNIIFTEKMLSMILLIFIIFLFKETLEVTGSITGIAKEIQDYNLPFILIICILPFIVGVLTGLTIGFVTLTLTVIFPLLSFFPDISVYSVLILSYTSGVVGILVSPVHICLILTKDYFGASLLGTIKKILLPILFLMLSAFAFYFLYS